MSEQNKNDELALKLLGVLKEKKDKIAKLSGRPHYKTNMTFFYSPLQKNINLNVVNDVISLATYYAFLKSTITNIVDAIADLEIEIKLPEPTVDGYTIEQWKEDFKTRAGVVNLQSEKEALKEMEKKIDRIVSKEKRDELELELMAKELLGQ